MTCTKCPELEAQLAEAREENAEHMNDAIQDGQAVKRFMDLNTTLTESVAEYKKLYYDTRTRAEAIRASLTERVASLEKSLRRIEALLADPDELYDRDAYHEAKNALKSRQECNISPQKPDVGAATAQVCMEHGYIRDGRDCKKCESATQERKAEVPRRVFVRESAGGNLTSGWALNTCDTDDVEFDFGHPGGRWIEFVEVSSNGVQDE